MSFNNIIGNDKIKATLNKALENGNITHSYMFIGTKGIGKEIFAKEFAEGILCINDNKPCKECKSCIEFKNNNNPDFIEISLEEKENTIKIDTVRNMQKKIQELPIVSNKKVYIIDDADTMTREAQNCLLKTLEEPPEYITIILVVSNENKILNTIKSRCLKIYFNDISNNELGKYIQSKYNIEEFSESMLKACQGSIGKVDSVYQSKEMYTQIDKIFRNIEDYSLTEVINKLEILYKSKDNIIDILDYLNTIFIEKSKDNYEYIKYISYVEETKRNLGLNCNYDMCIDKLLFNIWE